MMSQMQSVAKQRTLQHGREAVQFLSEELLRNSEERQLYVQFVHKIGGKIFTDIRNGWTLHRQTIGSYSVYF